MILLVVLALAMREPLMANKQITLIQNKPCESLKRISHTFS